MLVPLVKLTASVLCCLPLVAAFTAETLDVSFAVCAGVCWLAAVLWKILLLFHPFLEF